MDLPATDLEIEQALRGRKHGPPYPFESSPWDFVRRCWPQAAVRERVWPIVSRLLVDDDDLVRERALEFVGSWSDGRDVTTPRLLDVAEHHAALFGDQKPEGAPLFSALAQVLSNLLDAQHGQRIAALLRKIVEDTQSPVGATVLGSRDPEFVMAQALKFGEAQSLWIEQAATALALWRRDAVIPFLNALRGLPEPTRVRVLAAVEKSVKRNDEHAIAIAQSYGLPTPALPAPTTEECKRAIALS